MYLFIYDVILTAFRIILSTWLYNYFLNTISYSMNMTHGFKRTTEGHQQAC